MAQAFTEKMRTSSYFITRSLDAKQGLDLGLVIRIRYLDFIGKPVGVVFALNYTFISLHWVFVKIVRSLFPPH